MDFLLKRKGKCLLRVHPEESEAVKIAARNLSEDLKKTMNVSCAYSIDSGDCAEPKDSAESKDCPKKKSGAQEAVPEIWAGTLGVSADFDLLIDRKKLQDENGKLRREAYIHCVREGRLIIAGTDRRGTIYGIYELCEQLGVSPFYFWADVPVKEHGDLFLKADYEKSDYPSVEYRGIFINDEEELEAWVRNYMGESTIGVKTYEKVFELLLRLKGNYIWPAMHVNSFNMVQENGALADRMGIVVGTSHCDMLMRSNNREWKPWIQKKGYTDAEYDYSVPGRNREILKEYWQESVEQNKDFEVCYTLGMRGIHDSGFETRALQKLSPEEKKQAKVRLLSEVISDQREILTKTLGRDTMMTFIPYKEVLELYDSGLEIPEELTLVWANDNYGYIRRYPSEKEKHRKGGNGIYYHNSYWAPPSMSYVFFCSIPLAHTRNELKKAYQEGIRKLWVLNAGAMKPLEQEIAFFLRLAWEIGKEDGLTQDVDAYVADWIDRTFSGGIGRETAALLNDFSQLANVRKTENMDNDAFSQTAYGDEAAVRIHEYERLFDRGNEIYAGLKEQEKDAFFQLVLLRIHAAYFTALQYYYGDRSTLMYERGLMQAAALYTQKTREFDDIRRKMILYYNRNMAGGKWNGIVDPEGFPPPRTAMLPVCTPPLSAGQGHMEVYIWNDGEKLTFVKPGVKWIEIGNGGEGQLAFEIEAPDWVSLSAKSGEIRTEERILLEVKEVSEKRQGALIVRNLTDHTQIEVPIELLPAFTECPNVEEDGMVSVEAASAPVQGTGFCVIKRLGRGKGSLVEASTAGGKGLPYPFFLLKDGSCMLELHRFPSLDSTGRIRIGVSVDGGKVQIMESFSTDEWRGSWKKNVLDNVDRLYLQLPDLKAGEHSISFYPVDRYFAFSRFVIYTEERRQNNYAGIFGNRSLPRPWDAQRWAKEFYGSIELKPRPLFYAVPDQETDTLGVTALVRSEEHYAGAVEPSLYFAQGSSLFTEKEGNIRIDAASVLAQSEFAYAEGISWRHCASESYGRSGLAMYTARQEDNASLHYRLRLNGGFYTLWLLAKFNIKEESCFGVALDGEVWSREKLYGQGCLWRYEAEQIYRWVPLGQAELAEGEHTLKLWAPAPGLRFDRIYLTKGSELPPTDGEWK